MNQVTQIFKASYDHTMRNTAAATQILREIAALPPYHPNLEQYETEDGLVKLNCFYEVDPAEEETETDPRYHMQVKLCHVYVGNIDVIKGLTSTEAEYLEAAIKGTLE